MKTLAMKYEGVELEPFLTNKKIINGKEKERKAQGFYVQFNS